MATTTKETVKVESLGKWGPKINGEYYSWSKNIKDVDKGRVVPGGTFDLDIYVADSGKKYINAVKGSTEVLIKPTVVKPVDVYIKPAVTRAEAKSDAMSKDEWAAKDRRISRQGVIQVAVQVESDFDKAVLLAEKMLGFVNG